MIHDDQTRFMTPRERYLHYSQCLANNNTCPATPDWIKKRDKAYEEIQAEENRIFNLEQRVKELELRLDKYENNS